MCEGKIIKSQIEQYFDIKFDVYFKSELQALNKLAEDGLVEIEADGIEITPVGRFFLRNIAMVFDAYSKVRGREARFSKTL